MFLSTLLTIFLFFITGEVLPSAEASIVGSSCSQNGIIEKHGDRLVCMCAGKEVGPDQYCQTGMLFSVQSGLLEIVINKGNDSPEQLNTRDTESLVHRPIIRPTSQARPVAVTRGIQSIDEKESAPIKVFPVKNQCLKQ